MLRIHPAASRVALLASQTPARLVAFDLLALEDIDWTGWPFTRRRAALEGALTQAGPPIHLTPATTDRDLALDWLGRFEGAGLDGVVAKQVDAVYGPGPAGVVQGQAHPHRRLCGRRLPAAQAGPT